MRWPGLPVGRSERLRLLLFVASALAATLLGFVLVPPELGGQLIVHGGYYYILGVFGLWLYYAWRVLHPREVGWMDWLKGSRSIIGFLVAATAFAVWTDTFNHKLLFDDYVLQGTAWHMHATKEVGTPIRAYEFSGTWLTINTFLDKRPYFFAFLISLLHDLTGFRLANVYALNVILAFGALSSVFWIVRALTNRTGPAVIAVLLLATLPLFGQNSTGASMEMLNLTMIAVLMVAAILFMRNPNHDRLSLLVLGAVLLAQTRYESVLFVLPVAVIVVLGWCQGGRLFVSCPAILVPLLLVPYVWHDQFVDTNEYLWQLREGEDSRFGWRYVAGNMEGASKFFFSTSVTQPNSIWLVLLGLAGIMWAFIRFAWVRRNRMELNGHPAVPVLAVFAVAIGANLALLMFYYWSRLDQPVTARFALPMFLLLALMAGWFVHAMESRRVPALRIASLGLLAWLLVIAAPVYAQRIYTASNLIMRELRWELEQIASRRGPIFLLTSKASLPFLLNEIPTLGTNIAPYRAAQIDWHMKEGTFREVLVSQVIRPTTAEGALAVDPEDELPESFRLETIAIKRFGARWIRISRLNAIKLDGERSRLMPMSHSMFGNSDGAGD